MSETIPHRGMPKIYRLNKPLLVTEKIDGTSALVYVGADGAVLAGSRNRWLTPDNDNCGFAAWVAENAAELATLGHGYHHGEWWGQGIQRGYGLAGRRFSLFNARRWSGRQPACCDVVPWREVPAERLTLAHDDVAAFAAAWLGAGSVAAPGYKSPEGIVVCHEVSGACFKYTFGGDGHKGNNNG